MINKVFSKRQIIRNKPNRNKNKNKKRRRGRGGGGGVVAAAGRSGRQEDILNKENH